MSKYWEIEEGEVDSAGFLQALWRRFPQATTFYVEGTSMSGDVLDFYRLHKEEGDYLPARQTLFPRSRKFRCRFSASFAPGLSALAQKHAEAELLDHVALYDGSTEVVSWHDAFRQRASHIPVDTRADGVRFRGGPRPSVQLTGRPANKPLERTGCAGRSAPIR